MNVIENVNSFDKPTWLKTDYPILVLDNFITETECQKLIKAGEKTLSLKNNKDYIHGGRIMIPWTSQTFNELKSKSNLWSNFSERFQKETYEIFKKNISNNEFNTFYPGVSKKEIQECFLKASDHYSFRKKFFNKRLLKKYESFLEKKIKNSNLQSLIFHAALLIIESSWRKIISLIDFIKNDKPLLPLFDYSISNDGYAREIHRDSDNRFLVVLLYLNELDPNTEGGDLQIFKLKPSYSCKSGNNLFPPRPSDKFCTLQYKIKPRSGRLIMFLNQFNSYHGVSEMKNHRIPRHFLYGGFTFPSSIFVSRERLLSKSMPTEMSLY